MPVPFDLFLSRFACLIIRKKMHSSSSSLVIHHHVLFAYLERTSKRSRIMDFFRGRGRPAERPENDEHARDQSHISFIDKTSMK